jgi:hypothetical protein
MRLAKGNPPIYHLRGTGNNEDALAILLQLGMLVGFGGIFNGQRMQIELPLHPLQKIVTRLNQPDPDDMAGPFRPFTSLLDCDIGDFPAPGINSRINDAKLVTQSRDRQFGFGQHGRTSRRRRPCDRYG